MDELVEMKHLIMKIARRLVCAGEVFFHSSFFTSEGLYVPWIVVSKNPHDLGRQWPANESHYYFPTLCACITLDRPVVLRRRIVPYLYPSPRSCETNNFLSCAAFGRNSFIMPLLNVIDLFLLETKRFSIISDEVYAARISDIVNGAFFDPKAITRRRSSQGRILRHVFHRSKSGIFKDFAQT